MDTVIDFFTANVPAAYALALFFCGATTGSFLNVIVFRLPRGLSILSPPSACPQCGKAIFGLDNLPILSWFLLGGKCRQCKQSIPCRYPAVEFFTGCVWAACGYLGAGYAYGAYLNSAMLLSQLWFLSCMVAVSFIDIDYRIIPDQLSLGGLVVAVALSGLFPDLQLPHHPELAARFGSAPAWSLGLLAAFAGAAAGGGLMFAIRIMGNIVFHRRLREAREQDPDVDAIGLGDVKLMAFIGAFLGWKACLLTFLLSTLIGSVAGVEEKLRTGEWPRPRGDLLQALLHRWRTGVAFIPYGPFLCAAAAIVLLLRLPLAPQLLPPLLVTQP